MLLLAPLAFADITGTVFRDLNANGVRETGATYLEPGVGDITVSCVDSTGNTGSATTSNAPATLGQYSLTGCSGPSRVEFSGFLPGDYAGAVGGGNHTSVQFISAPAANVDFAVTLLGDYYGPGSATLPAIATSIMTNGDQSSGVEKSLVSIPYDASADWQADVTQQALDTDTGSIYGIAYKKDTNQIFSSAYLKRHVGLGPAGLDAIYVTTRGANDTQVFVRLQADLGINVGSIGNNAARGLGALTTPSHDVDAFNNVGKIGIGDIDISADGKILYVTNLFDKKLYAIKIDADNNPATKPVAADVAAYPIPEPATCSALTHTDIRINMGGSRYVQPDGTVWMAGSYSFGGQDGVTTGSIDVSAPGAADETLYKTWRDYLSGVHVPLQNGVYTVKLHFADFWGGAAPDGRSFDINFENGQLVENAFNIYEAAGGNGKAVVKTYTVTVNDNQLDIDFNAIKSSPMMAALEIIGSTEAPAGNWRPFAIGTEGNDVFVGGVCDALNSQNPADLKATVYRLDTGTGTFTDVLDAPLDYQKGHVYEGACSGQRGWFGWLPDNIFPPICDPGDRILAYPQPLLTDIDFAADRSMLLGFRDRLGDQVGQDNYTLTGTNLVNGVSAGDVLRAARSGNGYTLEANGSVAGLTSAGAGNNEGPGGGEFYYQDNFGYGHRETSMGSLASHKGFDQLLYNRIDTDIIRTGGIAWLSNLDAQQTHAYTLYNQSAQFMGKSTGLGDMELLLDPAPIEIGNRVWLDTNRNGVQDADESGVPNVQVQLLSGPTVLATATTDADGTYYFSNGTGTSTASHIYGVTALQPEQNYTLKFPTSINVSGSSHFLTAALAGGDPLVDSNAPATGEVAVNAADIPGPGANNHSFDVGYAATTHSIGNRVWIDANNNGLADVGETAAGAGVKLELKDAADAVLQTTTTDANGRYLFYGLAAGGYKVCVSADNFTTGAVLAGYIASTGKTPPPDANTDNTDGDDNGGDDIANGLCSSLVTLGTDEPTGETTATGDDGDDGHGTPDAHSNLTVDFGVAPPPPEVDLSLVKTLDKTTAKHGDTVVYTLTVSNTGPDAATNVTVSDQLPSGLTYVSNTPGAGTYDSASGVWTVGAIPAGGNATLAITATVQ